MNNKLKLLLYDIETAPDIFWGWGTGKRVIGANQLIRPGKIICISYRFLDWPKHKVKSLAWEPKKKANRFSYQWSDEKMLREFYEIAQHADILVGHNGDQFDCKTVNLRLAYYNIGSLRHAISEDTLKQSRQAFRSPSYKLDFLCKYFNIPGKLSTPTGLWEKVALEDCTESLKIMRKYCDNDVFILSEFFLRIYPYINHKLVIAPSTSALICPQCSSAKSINWGTRRIKTGLYQRLRCNNCCHVFPGSKIANQKEMR